VPSRVNHY